MMILILGQFNPVKILGWGHSIATDRGESGPIKVWVLETFEVDLRQSTSLQKNHWHLKESISMASNTACRGPLRHPRDQPGFSAFSLGAWMAGVHPHSHI